MKPELYLDLLKKSLLNEIYLENDVRFLYYAASLESGTPISETVLRNVSSYLPEWVENVKSAREAGRPWWKLVISDEMGRPLNLNLRNSCEFSHSMIGHKRMDNLHQCLDVIRMENVPGDFMETGVWRGGAVIFIRGYLTAYDLKGRSIWAADSFEGLPIPSRPEDFGYDFSAAQVPILAITLEEVQENFRRYGLLDESVRFLKGWFKDTLPDAPVKDLALLRLDGDLYESTMDALTAMYSRVSHGGFIIIDDYGDFPPCRKAVDEFRQSRKISTPLIPIDWTGVYWRKESDAKIC